MANSIYLKKVGVFKHDFSLTSNKYSRKHEKTCNTQDSVTESINQGRDYLSYFHNVKIHSNNLCRVFCPMIFSHKYNPMRLSPHFLNQKADELLSLRQQSPIDPLYMSLKHFQAVNGFCITLEVKKHSLQCSIVIGDA